MRLYTRILACLLPLLGAPLVRAAEPPVRLHYAHLLTNQYAYEHPEDPTLPQHPVWEVRQGTLFVRTASPWTGTPDAIPPDRWSATSTGSARFLMLSKRSDFRSFVVRGSIQTIAFSDALPPTAADGVRVLLRWQSDDTHYVVALSRRDGQVSIAKRQNGVSTRLASAPGTSPVAAFGITLNPGVGGLKIQLHKQEQATLTVTDTSPILGPGRVGVQGRNAEFVGGLTEVVPL